MEKGKEGSLKEGCLLDNWTVQEGSNDGDDQWVEEELERTVGY